MNDSAQSKLLAAPPTPAMLPAQDQDTWEAGRAAGLDWAADEARRGYRHPISVEPNKTTRLLIDHARQAFGGLTYGRRRPFIRGFVAGAAEFWHSQSEPGASEKRS